MKLHGEDLSTGAKNEEKIVGFEAMEEEEREIWLDTEQEDLLDVDGASIFYADFPPLPDFPCMSSSSSSSSTQAPVKAITSSSSSSVSSSSSAASWAVLKSDGDEDMEKTHHHHHRYDHHCGEDDAPPAALSSTASMEIPQSSSDMGIGDVDCMDVLQNFGYLDLLGDNDIWDASCIFHSENNTLGEFQQEQKPQEESLSQSLSPPELGQPPREHEQMVSAQSNNGQNQGPSEDLAMVFLDWLKNNKETVSADDLRKVKIKKSTIECASRRLGMKQLVKLVLEWVQNNHLQKRRLREASASNSLPHQYNFQEPLQSPSPNPNPNLICNPISPDSNSNPCFSQPPPLPQPPPYVPDPATIMGVPPGFPPPVVRYMGDPYSNGYPYPPPEYHMLESPQSWSPSQFPFPPPYNTFPENNLHPPQPPHPQSFASYGNQYPYPYYHGERLARLGSSATKEARKKRMARQRRVLSHHKNNNHHNQQNQNQQHNEGLDQHARLGTENCASGAQGNSGNWIYWSSAATNGAPSASQAAPAEAVQGHPADRPHMQSQNYLRQISSDRRQGWKPEKNLKFLLQKVLKQSDVGNLGRIVLPKKEAETHLPELETRDGLSLAMEDIGTSRVWNMRYRFWPNNKSRMYLLENTGDFVRANGLQEGDFIVIYSDVKCGKYLIRGVKVRQPGAKSETKRPAKSQKNLHASTPSSSTSDTTQTVMK